MPNNPTHPVNGHFADADVIRTRFDFAHTRTAETNTRIDQILDEPPGPQGEQDPPGEVTNAQLASAITSTSANANNVATLDIPFTDDPLALADGELLRAKLNELSLNGRR